MLETHDLHKRFGSTVALNGCSFSVERGRVLGFLGRNGAGKTTAMRSIFGLVNLDSGAIRWDGEAVNREMRMRFGYMPEERGLYQRMSVDSQLKYFARLRGLEAPDAQRESERWMARLDLIERRGSTVDSLSHGNQQKVQLGVSLIGDPQLLVLDEPFSGLDPIAVEVLSSVITEVARNGAAVVFSSHQLDLVGDVCDDIAIVTGGRVVLSGDLEEIRRSAPTRMLVLQLETSAGVSWADQLASQIPGSHVEASSDTYASMTVTSTTRPADILAALGDLGGQVSEFRLEPPNLEHVFRETVGESI